MSKQENQSTKNKTFWRWWAKALGEKASKCDKESDRIAIIRTLIFITYLITNAFIVAGVIRHWNDSSDQYLQKNGPIHMDKKECSPPDVL